MAGPLDGVRILDFSEIIAAPFAAMILADMGADVVKVEPPWGEPWRLQAAFMPLESRSYISLNRGKRSLPLDLTKPEAREIVYKLIPEMDVVLINYRPDTPYRLGIDYETLFAKNPRLIYCENTAFGRKGPHSQRPGYDIIAQAMTGLMSTGARSPTGLPQTGGGTAIADFSAGLTAAWSICAALYVRERTGRGQKVECSLLGSALAIQASRFLNVVNYDGEGRTQLLEDLAALRAGGASWNDISDHYQSVRGLQAGTNTYYRAYQTKDGVLALGNLSDVLRRRMAALLGIQDPRFESGFNASSPEQRAVGEEITQQVEAIFLEKTTEEWLTILDEARIPAGPVLFTEELEVHEQVLANDLVVELEHSLAGPVKMIGAFVKMSDTPLEIKAASPALGQHTEEILASLGYSSEEVQRLRQEGVTR